MYIFKKGEFKGKNVKEAFNTGKIEELVKMKQTLIDGLETSKNRENYLSLILEIEEVIIMEYIPLVEKFFNDFNKLSVEQKKLVKIDPVVFETNDIIGIKKILESMSSLKK